MMDEQDRMIIKSATANPKSAFCHPFSPTSSIHQDKGNSLSKITKLPTVSYTPSADSSLGLVKEFMTDYQAI